MRVPRLRPALRLAAALALASALFAAPVPVVVSSAAANPGTPAPAVEVVAKVLGKSVNGRAIRAWHFVNRAESYDTSIPTVVLIATMHGNEPATRHILTALRDGPPIHELDLWVVPVYNPDGLAAGSRKNAHGVDLNRNFPYGWTDLDGSYESGPKPASEPETQAMMRFLRRVRPDRILSFHQPLNGVDTDTKAPAFAKRVARKLNLPARTLDCGGVCHGTMTGWYNHTFKGSALTVEYGAHPSIRHLRRVVPNQIMSIFGSTRSETPPA